MMKLKLKLTLTYNGAAYCGWQAQANAVSIQKVLTDAAAKTYGVDCLVTGCSRTDSGVHAKNYVCTVERADGEDITNMIPPAAVPHAVNAKLPDDIAVIGAEAVPTDFHPRYSVKSKTYEYIFYDSAFRSPFYSGRAYHVKPLSDDDVIKMDAAARRMCGERDFASFMASGSKIVDTVRCVYDCGVQRRGDTVVFSVTANGFLYNMVRIMAGTVLAVANGKLSPEDIDGVIDARDRHGAGVTLPPYGLYLCRVEY